MNISDKNRKVYLVKKSEYSKDGFAEKTEELAIFLTEDAAKEFIVAEISKNYGDFFKYNIEPSRNIITIYENISTLPEIAKYYYTREYLLSKDYLDEMQKRYDEWSNDLNQKE
jgi:hypothetical protein